MRKSTDGQSYPLAELNAMAPSASDDNGSRTTLDRLREKIVLALPPSASIDVHDLDRLGWAVTLSLLHGLLYIALFLSFLVSGTLSEMSKKFLAIEAPEAGTAVCEAVPVAVTGTFLADINGRWSSDKRYDKTKALYQLDMTASLVTPAAFTLAMNNFTEQLRAIGERQKGYDVVSSQIAWDAFRAVANAQANMQFRPYSQIEGTFAGLRMFYGAKYPILSSREGLCDTTSFDSPTYSNADMILSTPFPAQVSPTSVPALHPAMQNVPPFQSGSGAPIVNGNESFAAIYEPCPDQIRIEEGVFGIKYSGTNSFDMDLRSALTAFALNMGIIDVSALVLASSDSIKFGSLEVLDEIFVSENYPDMSEVQCFTLVDNPRVCFALDLDYKTYIYPVITTTTYASKSSRRPCSCPHDVLDFECNFAKQIQLTLVFSKTGDEQGILFGFRRLLPTILSTGRSRPRRWYRILPTLPIISIL